MKLFIGTLAFDGAAIMVQWSAASPAEEQKSTNSAGLSMDHPIEANARRFWPDTGHFPCDRLWPVRDFALVRNVCFAPRAVQAFDNWTLSRVCRPSSTDP